MEKIWNEKFIEYMNFIINHPNYKGLPIAKKSDGSYTWVAPAKSVIGAKRIDWAKEKMKELKISENDNKPYAKLMFELHPTKEKPCQICGKFMSLFYIYINKNLISTIKKQFKYDADENQTIYQVCTDLKLIGHTENEIKDFLIKTFKLTDTIHSSIEELIEKCELACRLGNCKKLGPGAMSNFPDRFDGFHTYNRCCRTKEDSGRSPENLRTYGKDRRAYEYWSDGNIYAANIFMHSHYFIGTSADHVGPISLGFVHDPHYLRPLSAGENSSKRDKLSLNDIQTIIEIEKSTSVPAMSWFSDKIWEDIKKNYKKNESAIPIYREILKQNMSNFMFILWYIQTNCRKKGKDFLISSFLQPKFDCFNYNYTFDPYGNITSKHLRHKTDASRDEFNRYIRIAFESINDYNKKDNRNVKNNLDKKDLEVLSNICTMINQNMNNTLITKKIQNLMINIQIKLIKKNIL